MGYNAVQSGINTPTFRRKLLLQSYCCIVAIWLISVVFYGQI